MNHLWDIWLQKMSLPWNRGQRSLKVIGTDTYRSATYDFLLTFHNNHELISHRFHDSLRFHSKIAKYSQRHVFFAPTEGVPLGIGYRCRSLKNPNDGATRRSKRCNIGCLETIPACDGQTDRHLSTAKTALAWHHAGNKNWSILSFSPF